jgi:hypothetical protein
MELRNESENEFIDISSERWRRYNFPSSAGIADDEVRISLPCFLSVSKSGGHRILDEQGISHYIPTGWNHLEWEAKDGKPHFVK